MGKKLSDLGAVCVGGPYISDILLWEDCANNGLAGNVELSGSFTIGAGTVDPYDISLTGCQTIDVGGSATVTLTFGGTNGNYAYRIFNRHANFSLGVVGEGEYPNLEISTSSVSSTTVSWTISDGDEEETIPFVLTSVPAFNTWIGWDIEDKLTDNTFSITWRR